MRRREFMQKTSAAAGTAAAARILPARAQSHKNTLLTISESGPNSLDIMELYQPAGI